MRNNPDVAPDVTNSWSLKANMRRRHHTVYQSFGWVDNKKVK